MVSRSRFWRWALALLVGPVGASAQLATSATEPFILSANRVYAEMEFVRPDGTSRKTFVVVDLGSPSMVLSEGLIAELHVGSTASLTARIGGMALAVDASTVTSDSWLPFPIGANRTVEGVLPAGVLQRYQLRLDYASHMITLAQPGTLQPEGTAVPLRVNEKTGLVAVDVTIDGASYPMTIDNGSGYTWIRQSTALDWLSRHPEWRRGTGAVGPSNMRMADDGIEPRGVLVRLPEIGVGTLQLQQVGALAIAADDSGHDFMDWYSTKNAVPVIGWLGGNVLRAFRLTIDYPARVAYWYPESALDADDLDSIGLTLLARHGEYVVSGIVSRDGKPLVQGVQVGDRVVQIGALRVTGATRDAVFAAMHGRPGELRSVILERRGRQLQVQARVTAF